MTLGTALSKLGEVLLAPVNSMCKWAEEPLRRADYIKTRRNEGQGRSTGNRTPNRR